MKLRLLCALFLISGNCFATELTVTITVKATSGLFSAPARSKQVILILGPQTTVIPFSSSTTLNGATDANFVMLAPPGDTFVVQVFTAGGIAPYIRTITTSASTGL